MVSVSSVNRDGQQLDNMDEVPYVGTSVQSRQPADDQDFFIGK